MVCCVCVGVLNVCACAFDCDGIAVSGPASVVSIEDGGTPRMSLSSRLTHSPRDIYICNAHLPYELPSFAISTVTFGDCCAKKTAVARTQQAILNPVYTVFVACKNIYFPSYFQLLCARHSRTWYS